MIDEQRRPTTIERNGIKQQKPVHRELEDLDFSIVRRVVHAVAPVVQLRGSIQLDLEFGCADGALLALFVSQRPELLEVVVAHTNDQILELAGHQTAANGRPARRRASCSVLYIRQATVIGPTPPGTGVRWPAMCRASSKATSPTSLVLPSPRATRLMPTSITAAPGLIQSPRTSSGLPIATTRMSAVRQSAAKSRVREWPMVTVQSARSSSCATGRPTRVERPITTACLPLNDPSVSASSIEQPSGVQGTGKSSGAPEAIEPSRPTFIGWKPSTSLSGSTARRMSAVTMGLGSGSWTRMPCTAGSLFSRVMSCSSALSAVVPGRRWSKLAMPSSAATRLLLLT